VADVEVIRGWAVDDQALAERRRCAGQLVGRRVIQVRYVDLDYRGWDLGYRDQSKRRRITDNSEWLGPTWDAGSFHHLDSGVELALGDDARPGQ
jgi:hypothetical protein